MFVSYAQNFEDVMLWRALQHIHNGFYLDIGAQDPVVDSVSKGFYRNGWRGIHVEPTSSYVDKLRQDRPDEIVLQNVVGNGLGSIRFFEFPETGLSTGDLESATALMADGRECHETSVDLISLDAIFDRCKGRDIHWMKIDVEGMEASVLASWQANLARPWIVVVEATAPLSSERVEMNWQHLIIERGYELCYFDGLNCYFISDQHAELKGAFAAPPNLFDAFTLAGTATSTFASLLASRVAETRADLDRAVLSEIKLQEKLSDAHARHISDLEHVVAVCAKLDDARQREQELMQSILNSRRQADHLHAQVVSLHNSFSWRVMMPYRVLSKSFSHGARLVAASPSVLARALKSRVAVLFRESLYILRRNARLYRIVRNLINRNPMLRQLAIRALQASRGKPLARPRPLKTEKQHPIDLCDDDLATLSRVARITARQIGIH